MSEASEIPTLKITTLGGLAIQRGDQLAADLSSRKAQALLVYLAATGRAQPRELAADLLWPERGPQQASTSLRNTIYALRKSADPYITVTRENIAARTDRIWVDAAELEKALDAINLLRDSAALKNLDDLSRQLKIYQGEFLAGFQAGDSRGFEEWADAERLRLHNRFLHGSTALCERFLRRGAYAEGISEAHHILKLDPLNESGNRILMHLLAHSGQKQAALLQYETYQNLLWEDLGVEPDEETTSLYADLKADRLTRPTSPAVSIPSGTVTFLFTDIEGSTRLLQKLGDRYPDLLADHHRLMREAFDQFDGREIDVQGDSFFASFNRAGDATKAAVAIQRSLAGHPWPQDVQVRVRMGLHTGEPILGPSSYVGLDVHRAARIARAGHGGQVLVSDSTANLIQRELPSGVRLDALGEYFLKGFDDPERISQLTIDGLPENFPALQADPVGAAVPLHSEPLPLPGFLDDSAPLFVQDPPPFVGREAEMDRLSGYLGDAVSGNGRLALVTGVSGIGKSSLLRQFYNAAQEEHADLIVSIGSCSPYLWKGDPFLPFREVLRMLAGELDPAWTAGTISSDHAARLWGHLPETLKVFVEQAPLLVESIIPFVDLYRKASAVTSGSPDWLRRLRAFAQREPGEIIYQENPYLVDQYSQIFCELASTAPLLIILDDLQWADYATIDLLLKLNHRLRGRRLMVLGAYRKEEVSIGREASRHPLGKTLAELKTIAGDIWIDLDMDDRVQQRQFSDALIDLTPNDFDEAFRVELENRAAGHPLFTLELIKHLQEAGTLEVNDDGRWYEKENTDWGSLPYRVEGVIEERVERIRPNLRELLDIAAVEGVRFSAETVAAVAGRKEREVVFDLSDDLIGRHQILVEEGAESQAPGGAIRFRFKHSLIHDYIYKKLGASKKKVLHGEVGEILEEQHARDLPQVAGPLARHFAIAGALKKAIFYSVMAGDQARRLGAGLEAVQHYRRALDWMAVLPDGDTEFQQSEVYEKMGDAYRIDLSRQPEALECYEQFLSMTGSEQERGRGLRKKASVYLLEGDLEEAETYFNEALEILTPLGPSPDTNRIHSGLSYLYVDRNNPQRALEHADLALAASLQIDDPDGEAHAYKMKGISYFHAGQLDEALVYDLRGLEMYRELGDIPRMIQSLNNVGNNYSITGHLNEAVETYSKALEVAQRSGNTREEALLLLNLADVQITLGELPTARNTLEEAIHLAEESGMAGRQIAACRMAGQCSILQGDFAAAEKYLERAYDLSLQTKINRYISTICKEFAFLNCQIEQFEEAERWIERSEVAAQENGSPLYLGETTQVRGYIEMAGGAWTEAIQSLKLSKEYLETARAQVELGKTLLYLGTAWGRRNRDGDRENAAQALESAYQLFHKIGSGHYEGEVGRALEEFGIELELETVESH